MTKYLLLTTAVMALTACCGCMGMKNGNGQHDMMMMSGHDMAAMPAHNAALSCSAVKVSGMTCDACASTVKANLKKLNGVEDVSVDVKSGTVMVYTAKGVKADAAAVKAILAKSDYKFVSMHPSCK